MTDSITNSSEMLQTEPDGKDNVPNGALSVDQQLLATYDWGDAGWKADPVKQEYFRLSVNIAHDLGRGSMLNTNIVEALGQLGAVRSVGDNGKPSGKKQTNPDNPTGNTARGHGFFVPPRVAISKQALVMGEQATEAEPTVAHEPDAASKPKRKSKRKGIKLKGELGNTPSEPRVDPSIEVGEDGQPLEHETGAFIGRLGAVTFDLHFGGVDGDGDTGVALSGQAFVLEEQATEAEPTVTTAPEVSNKNDRLNESHMACAKGFFLDCNGTEKSTDRVFVGQPADETEPEVTTSPVDSGYAADETEPEAGESEPEADETPKAEAFPEFGSMDKSRVMGSVVRLDAVTRPAYLPALPVSGEVVQRVRNLGCSSTLIEAVSYAALGWKSFPLVANGKTPAVKSGFKEASADVGQLLAWFDDGEFRGRGSHSTANIGIATGETTAGYDLVVLDIDQKNGKDGSRVVSGAEGELGKLPETLVAQTPSGGLHYLFRAPKRSGIGCGVNVFKAKGEGLDIRADGGYIAASPSVVDGKQYLWKGDKGVAWLPDSWVTALQAECPVGGKRDAVSGSSIGDGEKKTKMTRGELLPMPADVALAIAEHAVPSDVGRSDGWLQVLSVLSAFEGGDALARHWSSTGAYADRFDAGSFEAGWDEVHSGWNSGVPMDVGTLFKRVYQHSPDWKTPEQRKREANAAALKAEQRKADGFPALPAYLQTAMSTPNGGVPDPVAAVTDDKAVEVLNTFIAKGNEVGARVSAGLDVGHDAEYLFIAGMLTMNAEAMKYQVEHNPVPKGRSSKYMTTNGKLRAVIMHNDGGKPETADAVDMDLFTPDYVGGTADAVTRLANRIMLERDAALGAKPTGDECVLVRRVFELSPLGQYWRGNATEISKRRIGWSLDSAVENGLSRATRYATNTHQALSGTGSGLDVPAMPSRKRGYDDSQSAEQVIVGLAEEAGLYARVAFDAKYAMFYIKVGDVWKQESDHNVQRLMAKLAFDSGVKHGSRTVEGATRLLAMRMEGVRWCEDRHLIPMTNGVLDVNTGALRAYADCQPFNWQLPYPYDPQAQCPTWMDFISTALCGDSDAVSVVQAFFRCIFVGDSSAEKYLEVTGSGGTGKSTLMKVVKMLVGDGNTASTSFRALEENRFEPAALLGARLILIPDTKKYAGDMEVFKKLTGHDPLPYEPKNVQRQRGTDFVNEAPVIVTSNGEIKSSETSSGILRRRLKIRFDRIVSDAEKARYGSAGIESVLKRELSGIVNWALSISSIDALKTLRNPGDKLNALAEATARNNDPVLAWLTDNCVRCAEGEETPIGRLAQGGIVSAPILDLYPHFVDYCEGDGIRYTPTVSDFVQSIVDHCNRRGGRVERKQVWSRNSPLRGKAVLTGVRLRKTGDAQDADFFGSR